MNKHRNHRAWAEKQKSNGDASSSAESTRPNKIVIKKKKTTFKDQSCSKTKTSKSKQSNIHSKGLCGEKQQHSHNKVEEVNPNSHIAMNYNTPNTPPRRNRKRRKKNDVNNFQNHGKKTLPLSSSHSGSQRQASTSAGQDPESDIPGFYFDKEKNCYFKILPNTMTTAGSFVTKETIEKKEAEKQRQLDLKQLKSSTSFTCPVTFSSTLERKRDNKLLSVLKDLQCGQFTCENLKTYMVHRSCANIQPDTECRNYCPTQLGMKLDDVHNLLVSPNRDRLVCVSSLKSCIAQCIQLMTVGEDWCPKKKKTVIAIKPPNLAVGPIYKKISSICWAPLPNLPGNHTILYTTTCPIGYFPSIVQLINLDISHNDPHHPAPIFELNLGFKTIWASAWNSQKSSFSIGSERKCHVIDFSTRSKWTYNTYNSDPLAQVFSPSNSNLLYCGTRAGLILTHDVRALASHRPQAQIKQSEGIGCLRLQQDENYVIASDFSGTICTWDQRLRKAVVKCKGLVNSHYQLPFHLDETETLICSTGSDSYTKIWDCRNGTLLKSLPPPFPASLESFPRSFYSNRWGNVDCNKALVIAMKDIFKVYC